MNCTDFREIADSYLSDELLTETNHDMIRHMELCSDCRDLIGARREIRTRLKSAVTSAPEYQLREGFDHILMTRLRQESGGAKKATGSEWFGMRSFAMAAGLVVVAMLGFALVSSLNQPSTSPPFLVSSVPPENLINIASGDHQHCAIDHDLDEAPVALGFGDKRYSGLDKLVEKELSVALADYKLVEAHACKYKDVRFAHFVMQGPADTLSVLIAPSDEKAGSANEKIAEFSSASYRVSKFDVETDSVFVISTLDAEQNRKAAESLTEPFERHYSEFTGVQTALLHLPEYRFASFAIY